MFDFTNDEASSGKPKGKFNARICEAKLKKSQAGNDMINMKLAIVGPKYNKFPIFENFVMNNEIARGRFSDLLDKTGTERKFESLSVLLNKIVGVELGADKEGRVKVKGFYKAEEQEDGEDF